MGWNRLNGVWKVLWEVLCLVGKLFEGLRAPHWMWKCPDWVPTLFIAASGVVGLLTSVFESGKAKVTVLVVAGAFVILATLISMARNSRARHLNREKDDWIEKAQQDFRDDRHHLLSDQLHNLVQLVADAVATPVAADRHVQARVARTAIIAGAANMIGLKAEKGTRANLFRLSRDRSRMTLEPGGFSGRGDRSTRTFLPGDKTFEATMRNVYRFVGSVDDLQPDSDLPYKTFLTYPVSIDLDHIHGVLTVDCLHEGELNELDDVPPMAVLASLLAMTYECEKYPSSRNLSDR